MLREGSSEQVNTFFSNYNYVILKIVYCFNLPAMFEKYIFAPQSKKICCGRTLAAFYIGIPFQWRPL
jgi:hypothetical protein